jgi:hypothetical protein
MRHGCGLDCDLCSVVRAGRSGRRARPCRHLSPPEPFQGRLPPPSARGRLGARDPLHRSVDVSSVVLLRVWPIYLHLLWASRPASLPRRNQPPAAPLMQWACWSAFAEMATNSAKTYPVRQAHPPPSVGCPAVTQRSLWIRCAGPRLPTCQTGLKRNGRIAGPSLTAGPTGAYPDYSPAHLPGRAARGSAFHEKATCPAPARAELMWVQGRRRAQKPCNPVFPKYFNGRP